MKKWNEALLVLLGLILLTATACNLPGRASNDGNVKVTRGDLEVVVTGSGSLATQQEARLSFRTTGKIQEVACKEGDAVSSGDALASLESDSLVLAKKQAEVDLAAAELAVSEAKMAVTDARLAYQTAQNGLETARNTGEALRVAVANAQIAADQARNNLNAGISAADFDQVEADLHKAQLWYDYILENYPDAEYKGTSNTYLSVDNVTGELWVDVAREALEVAQANYDNALSGYDSRAIALKKQQVEAAEMALTSARNNMDSHSGTVALQESKANAALNAVGQVEQGVAYARQAKELAGQALELAEKNLADATLTAPFDGIVAGVMADSGDAAEAGTPVIHLVNPTELELLIEVDEIDVPRVRTGQQVRISVDAFPDQEFTGTVESVYPIPANVTGLVMYDVKLALTVPQGAGLKIGMRATANIIVEKKTDVVLVPSGAVMDDEQGGHYVNVMVDKKVERRPVTVGISDDFNTEVLGGLSEGETVSTRL